MLGTAECQHLITVGLVPLRPRACQVDMTYELVGGFDAPAAWWIAPTVVTGCDQMDLVADPLDSALRTGGGISPNRAHSTFVGLKRSQMREKKKLVSSSLVHNPDSSSLFRCTSWGPRSSDRKMYG